MFPLIYYSVLAMITFLELVILLVVYNKQKNTFYALLFISIFIANLGFLFECLSRNAEEALLAVKLTYFSGTFVMYFFLCCILQICDMNIGFVHRFLLVLLNLEVMTSVFSAGYGNTWHYKDYWLVTENGYSRLEKEYGPHHTIYIIIVLINIIIPLGIIIYSAKKTKKTSWRYTSLLGVIQVLTIFSYFIENTLNLDVKLIPLCQTLMSTIILTILHRAALYDVSHIVEITLSSNEEKGIVILSPSIHYIKSDKTVQHFFPEINELVIDKPVTNPFFVNTFGEWILRSKDEPVEPKYLVRNGEDIKLCVSPFYSYGRKKKHRGYLIDISVDTTTQNYIRQLKESTRLSEILAKKADAANKSKTEFLANMSHEIRTPLNAVLGLNEMVLRETKDEAIRNYSVDIKSYGHAMLGLVNDLLDMSKIEAGKVELIISDYDLSEVIYTVGNMISMRAADKGLTFNLDVDPRIPRKLSGDEMKIRQIITNILTNAVKYTETGSVDFTVSYDVYNSTTDKLCFTVSDTGIGMKPEAIEHLFTPFERLDEVKNKYIEGTGLGMSITQNYLKLMDSKLNVESVYGAGSTFSFTILQEVVDKAPIGDFEAVSKRFRAKSKIYKASFTAKDATVLVVDDTSVNLKVFCGLLKETLLKIDTASSGFEAIELCKENKYDCIFIDHMMPKMDGIETLGAIKQFSGENNTNTPMIAMTANISEDAKETYRSLGFSDYISKPLPPSELEALLIRHLPKEKVKET